MIPRLQLRTPKLRTSSSSFNGRTLRLGHQCSKLYAPVKNLSGGKEFTSNVGKKRKSMHRGPAKHWLSKPAIVYRGEREICNPATDEGRAEYKWRTLLMWLRQDGWCCFHEYDFCPGRMHLWQATFEHEGKRTMARQDDRISFFDKAGKEQPLNGAAHAECNGIAGSRMLPIFHGFALFQVAHGATR